MAYIVRYSRPRNIDDGTQLAVDADYLRAVVDTYEDGSCLEPVILAFADYPGLESEYTAGAATTVLQGAVADVLGNLAGDALTTPQRDVLEDVQIQAL